MIDSMLMLYIMWMKSRKIYLLTVLFIASAASILTSSCSSDSNNDSTAVRLNVVTVNLLFSELPDRSIRLEAIADLIEERHNMNDPLDIILLQEVVGGLLSGTANSSVDLLNMLSDRGLNYYIFSRLSNGLPAILQEGNAILSRHEIRSTDYTRLPNVSEEINEDFQITLRQEIIMARVHVPGFGEVNIYNTHFCAFCDPAGRLEQTRAAMSFIESTESLSGRDNPVILGGTYAVPGNPYALPLFPGQPIEIGRIDYIFTKNAAAMKSDVIFDDFPWVSDHSGVLTKISIN